MKACTKNYFRAIALMCGMIIGVGLFGLPYVIGKSGAAIGLAFFVIVSVIVVLYHLMFGETILRTKAKHRLAGLAGVYLGKGWRWPTVVASTLGFYSVIIAYIIVGGEFLHILLSPFLGGNPFAYQVIFFAIMAGIILVGLRTVIFTESFMTTIEVLGLVFLTALAATKIHFSNFLTVNAREFFAPYGVILFSITGAAAVPEVLEIMSREKKNAKRAIVWGSVIPIVLIALFAFAVLGATDGAVSKDAIEGLRTVFGGWVGYVGAAFGLFAVTTSFLPLALYAKEQFHFDFKMNGFASWALAVLVPFAFFLFGTKDFIAIIGFSGAVFSGYEGLLMIWIYRRAKRLGTRTPEYEMRLPLAILVAVGLIFLLGMAYEVSTFFT